MIDVKVKSFDKILAKVYIRTRNKIMSGASREAMSDIDSLWNEDNIMLDIIKTTRDAINQNIGI